MKKKYVYARENLKLLIAIGLIVGLPLLALSIYMIIDLGAMGYGLLATFIILFIILIVFSINSFKWRIWHNKIKINGMKVPGKIIGFGYKYKSGNIRHDPPTPATEQYWLKVKYVDNLGNEKIHETPVLSFRPEERKDITCDVYIYNEEILATNFVNLGKKKIDWQEVFLEIVVGIVFVGICALIAWLKNR